MPIVARGSVRRPGLRARLAVGAALLLVLQACAPQASPSGTGAGSSPGLSGPVETATSSGATGGGAPSCPPIPPMVAQPWWTTAVFYEVFVRSFADSNGDGIGDLDGLTAHLDYLNDGDPATTSDLGVTALWLMPVAQSPSYHGYDVTDYEKVEQDYGDSAAFKRLVAAAHARGIKVVIDFEANHTSDQHPWFRDALAGGSHHDWYVWSATDPGWPNPIGGGDPWHASSAGYYYGLFGDSMPDLNLRNPAVTTALEGAASFWLDTMGVDGFRMDAARHLIEDGPTTQVNTPETRTWLEGFRTFVHADHPDALVVGEVNDPEPISASYVADGALDMTFDYEIGPEILNAVSHGDAGSLSYVEASLVQAYAGGGAAPYLTNHDEPRAMTQLHGDEGAAAESAATLLTLPGTPFIYYGEELGMTGDKPDEQIRTPFPWTAASAGHGFTTGTPWEPFGDGVDSVNVATESADPSSLLATYRALVHLREDEPVLATGGLTPVDASDNHVVAAVRSDASQRLLVVQNLGTDPAPGVALTLRSGPLCGSGAASVAWSSAGLASVASPAVTPAGGFSGYVPTPILAPRSTLVIALGS